MYQTNENHLKSNSNPHTAIKKKIKRNRKEETKINFMNLEEHVACVQRQQEVVGKQNVKES